MKRTLFFLLLTLGGFAAGAQQRIDTRKMNFLPGLRPNNILYRDTLYSGSRQFGQLFRRTGDPELLDYYYRHEANKITGNVLGLLGTVATTFGLVAVADNRGGAWALVGGGFATTLFGGYLIMKGQQNLLNAVTLFNSRYNQASLNLGLGNNRAGIALNF